MHNGRCWGKYENVLNASKIIIKDESFGIYRKDL